jgi:hypothetical protein
VAVRLTPEQRVLRAINETAWRNNVVLHARTRGWKVYFVPDRFHANAKESGSFYTTKMGDRGYPDLTLVGPSSIIFVELKTETGRLSPDQEEWRDRIVAAGGEWFLWRPSHLDDAIKRLEEG